jgi:hypothetical protein
MASGRKKRSSGKEQAKPYTFSDEVTKNKIKKHITDILDVITEQDIANVKVPGEEDTLPVLPIEENEKSKDEEKGRLAGEGKPITPWDVID